MTVPEVHGRPADVREPGGLGGAAAGIQGEQDACPAGLPARRGRTSQPPFQFVTVDPLQSEVRGRLHGDHSTKTALISTSTLRTVH